MSGLPLDATEPDPSATSLPNEQIVKQEGGDRSAPPSKDNPVAETVTETVTEGKSANGSAEVKEEVIEEKKEIGSAAEVKSEYSEKKDLKRKQRTYEDGVLKTSATQVEGSNNSKYNPKVLPRSDDPKLIRAQVEFYFSDSNLPEDEFLWELTGGASNLPVSISRICSFGRMKRFQPESAVVAALRESNFLTVSGPEGAEQISRKTPYDPNIPGHKSTSRSIYAKGFVDEEPSSQFDIEAFFAPYGPTRCVRLRRTDNKLFKGSVFVEFQDEETAEKFMKLEPKPLWKGTHVLKILTKQDYIKQKEQEIKDGKIEPQLQRNGRGRGKGRGRGGYRGNDRRDGQTRENRDQDPDDWKKRREDDRAAGFKDNRNNRKQNNRGDRRGGRGGKRENNGSGRGDQSRNEEKAIEAKNEDSLAVKTEASSGELSSNGQKRAREDDGGEDKPAKKVDVKAEVEA
ncbi:La domain-containing protein [Diplocarpon rosae]|nr:La domain-containing protein [Diplocarpon rosae]